MKISIDSLELSFNEVLGEYGYEVIKSYILHGVDINDGKTYGAVFNKTINHDQAWQDAMVEARRKVNERYAHRTLDKTDVRKARKEKK